MSHFFLLFLSFFSAGQPIAPCFHVPDVFWNPVLLGSSVEMVPPDTSFWAQVDGSVTLGQPVQIVVPGEPV